MKKNSSCIQEKGLSVEFLENTSRMLRMLAHPHRLKIIEILDREGECNVTTLIDQTGLPQSSVSLHLNQMKRMHLLGSRRNGREVVYHISDPRVLRLLNCICCSYKEDQG
ncbi:MAG: metalloregulator ArsR/SmtB family transcription factor [Kiritimatiellae bacterium]|jgi:DNA-binding transcriptional ArsR family regulator|nr:metalloregulator ArsR/SmtB family transcription factor [Kiritimatiellia bacterium]